MDGGDDLGYSVARRPREGPADVWCDSQEHQIVIHDELPANAQVRVLVHEIAHALGVGYTNYGRRRAEVLVDTVTFIVCGAVGLDTSGSTVPMSRAGVRAASWTRSAATRRRSMRSPAGSKTASGTNRRTHGSRLRWRRSDPGRDLTARQHYPLARRQPERERYSRLDR
jgi:hypothetical protein